jgi:hypothetical protein
MIDTTRALARPYEPTPRERTALEAQHDRRRRRRPAPSVKVSIKDGGTTISSDHPDNDVGGLLLMEALGTADPAFVHGLMGQLGAVASKAQVYEDALNFKLAFLRRRTPDIADDRLSAIVHGDIAHAHRLFTTPVSLQRLHLSCERPREFIEGPFGTVLLGNVLRMIEPKSSLLCELPPFAPRAAPLPRRAARSPSRAQKTGPTP